MDFKRIDRIRRGGQVERYHSHGLRIQRQNVAEHSWNVATLAIEIRNALGSEGYLISDGDIYEAALYHDLGEYDSGDLPGWVKDRYPALKHELDVVEVEALARLNITLPTEYGDYVRAIIKTADLLDVLLWALDEIRLGNQDVSVLYARNYYKLRAWLDQCEDKLKEPVLQLVDQITTEFRDLQGPNGINDWIAVQNGKDYFSQVEKS